MRLFAALELADEARDALAEWWVEACLQLEPSEWRDVPAHNWHLTLAFYGEVDGRDVADLAEALSSCAAQVEPFWLVTGGMGVFPSPKRPRVFWAGVNETAEGGMLKRLARCCRHEGHAMLRKREDHRGRGREAPFQAHVTMARARYPEFLEPVDLNILRKMPPVPEISWQVERLGLYHSILKPEGARYHLLETYEFE